jgi:hypothetical protein
VRLAKQVGTPASVNAYVTEQVHRIEQAGLPPPFLTPAQVWAAIG